MAKSKNFKILRWNYRCENKPCPDIAQCLFCSIEDEVGEYARPDPYHNTVQEKTRDVRVSISASSMYSNNIKIYSNILYMYMH